MKASPAGNNTAYRKPGAVNRVTKWVQPEKRHSEFQEEVMILLRFDGIYCRITEDTNYCLRFYADGLVIDASVGGPAGSTPFPRAHWFNRCNPVNLSRGNWIADRNETGQPISFSAGKVDYQGEIGEDKLILSSLSHINGHRAVNREYVFFPFNDIPGWDLPEEPSVPDDEDDHDDDNRSQDQY